MEQTVAQIVITHLLEFSVKTFFTLAATGIILGIMIFCKPLFFNNLKMTSNDWEMAREKWKTRQDLTKEDEEILSKTPELAMAWARFSFGVFILIAVIYATT